MMNNFKPNNWNLKPKYDEKVNVNLRGGNLLIECIDESIYMTGESIKVFEGEYYA